MSCLSTCPVEPCVEQCAAQYPAGLDLYLAFLTCAMCEACPDDCAEQGQGSCG